MGPQRTSGSANVRALLDTISFAEGTGASYGTIYGGNVVPELAAGELTVAEVMEMQRTGKVRGRDVGYARDQYNSDATGRYQFMSFVLKEEVEKQGISMSEKFTPALQDKLILGRMARMRGVTTDMIEAEGLSDNIIDRLAPEFASFPNLFGPDYKGRDIQGTSFYGQGGKSAQSLRERFQMERERRMRQSSMVTVPMSQQVARTSPTVNVPAPPVMMASMTTIGGNLSLPDVSTPSSVASASQTEVQVFSASDPSNLSVIAAKSVYGVVT